MLVMKFGALTAVSVVALVYSTSAAAKTVPTPVGPVDNTCVHKVPNNAFVDLATGAVTLSGSVVAQYDPPCAVSWAPNVIQGKGDASGGRGGSTAFWYDFSLGQATTINGLTQFNLLEVEWVVPPAPQNQDGSILYLFPAFENLSNPNNINSWVSIFQPIIQWGLNDIGDGGEYWLLQGMAVVNGGGVFVSENSYHVYPNDIIYGYIYQYQTNPDAWTIFAWDETQDEAAIFSAGSQFLAKI